MTLRELINSVDSEQYSGSVLYQELRETKPEYGSNKRIGVKLVNSAVAITNVHVGSLGDILTYSSESLNPSEESSLIIASRRLTFEIFKSGSTSMG